MEEVWVFGSVIFGFALRIGVPLLLTIMVGRGLLKLDAKWKEDGQKIRIEDITNADRVIEGMNCWEFFECSDAKRSKCKVLDQSELPCWEIYQKVGGDLAECLTCKYRELNERGISPIANIVFRD